MFLWEDVETAWVNRGREENGHITHTWPGWPDWPEKLTGGVAFPADDFGEAEGTGDGRKGNA